MTLHPNTRPVFMKSDTVRENQDPQGHHDDDERGLTALNWNGREGTQRTTSTAISPM
jgi:hypothetical protein